MMAEQTKEPIMVGLRRQHYVFRFKPDEFRESVTTEQHPVTGLDRFDDRRNQVQNRQRHEKRLERHHIWKGISQMFHSAG